MLRKYICILIMAALLLVPARSESNPELPEGWDSIQSIEGSENLLIRSGEAWGMASPDGKILIEPRFSAAPEFKGGYAVTQVPDPFTREDFSGFMEQGHLSGLINARGEIILPAEYDHVHIHSEIGLAELQINDLKGLANLQGEIIAPLKYNNLMILNDHFIAVSVWEEETRWGVIDRTGAEILPTVYLRLEQDPDKPFLVHLLRENTQEWERFELKAQEEAPPAPSADLLMGWEKISRIPGSENLLVYSKERWGMIDGEGKILLDPQLTAEPSFQNGYAVAMTQNSVIDVDFSGELTFGNLFGLINTEGEITIPMEFDSLKLSDDGLIALVQVNDQLGFMRASGETITKPEFARAEMFVGDYAAVGVKIQEADANVSDPEIICWGLIDRRGKIVLPLHYDKLTVCENGLVLAKINDNYGFLDPNGNAVTRLEYSNAEPFVGNYAAVAVETQDCEGGCFPWWGVIDSSGKTIIECKYASLELAENETALVSSGDLYGYINLKDEWIAEPKYERAKPFEGGLAIVGREEYIPNPSTSVETTLLWGLIDDQGREVLPMEYDSVVIGEDEKIYTMLSGRRIAYEIMNGKAVEIKD